MEPESEGVIDGDHIAFFVSIAWVCWMIGLGEEEQAKQRVITVLWIDAGCHPREDELVPAPSPNVIAFHPLQKLSEEATHPRSLSKEDCAFRV